MSAILEARELVKRYPKVTAVDGLSLSIAEGTCFGLLGPNGAGKTTTVEMMEGLTPPSSGEVRFRGQPLDRHFKQAVGIQFQSTTLQDFLTTRECIELFASFYPSPLPTAEVMRMCSLEAFADQDNRKLSGGQRQRLYLALALVNDPQLLFLDEPTTGLDPQARQNFWELIRSIKAKRKTIVLTTHYMEEAYALCDEIAIMDRGRIIAQGTPEALLMEHFEGVWLELPRGSFTPPPDFPWKVYATEALVGIHTANVNETLRHLMAQQVSLEGLRVKAPTLDDLFLELTGRELRA
ncbi:MAG TPA: ABC transporter ATP-binding protein [bacterium]|nr:ABC transporter ATP-binding protein [bacterium]